MTLTMASDLAIQRSATRSRVGIAIVNYRTAELTIDCLRSLAPEMASIPGSRVVVVDNASGDGSAERIGAAIEQENWEWAAVLPQQVNGGFAFGNNAAIRELMTADSPQDYVMLLNPDTVVRPGAVRTLAQFMDARPDVGIAGSVLEDARGEVQPSAFRFHNVLSELEAGADFGPLSRLLSRRRVVTAFKAEPHECEWVSGASMIVRREVLEVVGPFDEGYFLYFEEADLCRRCRAAGWSVWTVPASRVVHLEGAATGISVARKRRMPAWFVSRRRFFVKHYGAAALIAADALWAVGRFTLAIRKILHLARRRPGGPKRFAVDLLWGDARALSNGSAFRAMAAAKPPQPENELQRAEASNAGNAS